MAPLVLSQPPVALQAVRLMQGSDQLIKKEDHMLVIDQSELMSVKACAISSGSQNVNKQLLMQLWTYAGRTGYLFRHNSYSLCAPVGQNHDYKHVSVYRRRKVSHDWNNIHAKWKFESLTLYIKIMRLKTQRFYFKRQFLNFLNLITDKRKVRKFYF